jgi:hypothetical protein
MSSPGATLSSVPVSPVQSAASGPSVVGTIPWVLIAAIVTASVSAWLAIWTARRKSREEERSRQRTLFAEAYQAYAAYKEMPYAIRRRRGDDLPGERVRLSEITREIQSRLSYYEAWIAAESTPVGEAYSHLIGKLRKVAGGAMREAWNAAPITTDTQMNMPPTIVDLSPLSQLEKEFTQAAHAHLDRLAPWWKKPIRRSKHMRQPLATSTEDGEPAAPDASST